MVLHRAASVNYVKPTPAHKKLTGISGGPCGHEPFRSTEVLPQTLSIKSFRVAMLTGLESGRFRNIIKLQVKLGLISKKSVI